MTPMMYKLRVARGWGAQVQPGWTHPPTQLIRALRIVYDRYGPLGAGDDWFRCVRDKPRRFPSSPAEHVARSRYLEEREILNSVVRCVRRRWEAR